MIIRGNGKPTKQTKADFNDIYIDSDTELQYRCSMIVRVGFETEYWWEPEPITMFENVSSYEDFIERYYESDEHDNKKLDGYTKRYRKSKKKRR